MNDSVQPQVSIWNGRATRIQIEVEQTSLRKAQQSAEGEEWTPEQPWFAHRLSGSRRLSGGPTAYAFQQGPELITVRIPENGESEETMNRFFDSFQISLR